MASKMSSIKCSLKMEQEQAKRIIEALLFASDRPLTCAQIKEVLEELEPGAIRSLIAELKSDYTDSGRSFNIQELAGGYRISSDPQYAQWLKKLYQKSRQEKLSHPALETIAIIAYRQPITRQEIEDIRGVNVDAVLKTLMDRSLVRIRGRKSVPGRPFLYGTTRQFLEFFGMQTLADLPKLEEFHEAAFELQEKDRVNIREKIHSQPSGSGGGKENGEVEEISQENRPD